MVAKSEIKYIRSLQQKKFRQQHKMFVAEGVKLVEELSNSSFINHGIFSVDPKLFTSATAVTETELKQMSSLVQPNKVLGVFGIPDSEPPDFSDWVLALDGIRDPGNLGTLIRICDWFGIAHLICSPDTVDAYNPKVLQATMGSIARVKLQYTPLEPVLKSCGRSIFGASMEGYSLFSASFSEPGIIVMGSESHGLTASIRSLLNGVIAIPGFGRAESLNVGAAAAVLLYEIRRQGKITQK